MTQTSYNSGNPPPTLYHRCGQPVQVSDRMMGYSLFPVYLIDGQAVRYCSCGVRLWEQTLLQAEPRFCLDCGRVLMGDCPLCSSCLDEADERDADHHEDQELRFAAQCGIL